MEQTLRKMLREQEFYFDLLVAGIFGIMFLLEPLYLLCSKNDYSYMNKLR